VNLTRPWPHGTDARVRFVFADDSEEKHPRRSGLGHLVGVGAVLFPEGSLLGYTEGIRQLRNELGIPLESS